jgi:hypothetical protein
MARLTMLVLPDDAQCEICLCTGQRAARHEGRHFTRALYDEAKRKGRTVISTKNDWKYIFAFES